MLGLIRRYFLAGVVVTIPTLVTLYVLNALYSSLRQHIGNRVEHYLASHVGWMASHPGTAVLVGLLLTVALLVAVGFISSTVLGAKFVGLGEHVVQRVPLIGWVYGTSRQVVGLLFAKNQTAAFRRVVLVQYPHPGSWVMGFVTADGMAHASERTGKHLYNVFVPFSPTPVTGILLLVPSEDVIELDYTIEEGMKLAISGGVLTPDAARKAKGEANG